MARWENKLLNLFTGTVGHKPIEIILVAQCWIVLSEILDLLPYRWVQLTYKVSMIHCVSGVDDSRANVFGVRPHYPIRPTFNRASSSLLPGQAFFLFWWLMNIDTYMKPRRTPVFLSTFLTEFRFHTDQAEISFVPWYCSGIPLCFRFARRPLLCCSRKFTKSLIAFNLIYNCY